MMSDCKTTHIDYKNLFYSLTAEKVGIPLFTLWMVFILCVGYLADRYGSGEVQEVSIGFYIFTSFALSLMLAYVSFFGIIPAYYRGKFLRKRGYCIITPERIEAICCDQHQLYDYHNRSIKTKKHKDGSVDIFIENKRS